MAVAQMDDFDYYNIVSHDYSHPTQLGTVFQTLSDEDRCYYLTFWTYNWLLFIQILVKNWLKKHQLFIPTFVG
jgi:hypothetical protein